MKLLGVLKTAAILIEITNQNFEISMKKPLENYSYSYSTVDMQSLVFKKYEI